MENVRQKHLDWIEAILNARKWSRTELARKAQVDPSTLTKFWNDPTGTARLNTYTIEKIERAAGIKAFETAPVQRPRGFSEAEASPFENRAGGPSAAADAWRGNSNTIDAWVLKSNALEAAGYLPGDIMLVEAGGSPRPGDIVLAEITDRSGNTEEAFRIYEPPFLVAATFDRSLLRPTLIDNTLVSISGVVIGSIRPVH